MLYQQTPQWINVVLKLLKFLYQSLGLQFLKKGGVGMCAYGTLYEGGRGREGRREVFIS